MVSIGHSVNYSWTRDYKIGNNKVVYSRGDRESVERYNNRINENRDIITWRAKVKKDKITNYSERMRQWGKLIL